MFGKTIASVLVLGLTCIQADSSTENSVNYNITSTASNNTRVVGGQAARRADFPYQVSLRRSSGNSAFCGASIINDRHLLTAAHCVVNNGVVTRPSAIRAVVGDLSIAQTSSTTITRVIKNIFVHDDYNENTIENDVAVLRIDSLGDFNDNVNNISLATGTPEDGASCVVSGWGTTVYDGSASSVLLYANVSIISTSTCRGAYGALLYSGMLCAGNSTYGGVDACQGDSGGPLACNNALAGIVSWGIGCAEARYPGVYTDVSSYRSWIERQLARDNSYILINNLHLTILLLIVCVLLK